MYSYLDKLNDRQREAATTIEGPVLIIAGAGSGKTTTLIHRVSYMIDNNIDPNHILLLTFTNEAARNMIEKAAKNANEKCKNITACTYHSFCAKILRKYGYFISIPGNFEIITNTDGEDIIKIIKQKNIRYKTLGFPSNAAIIQIFSKTINMDIASPNEFYLLLESSFPKYSHFCSELLDLFSEYRKYKKEHNILDYDDLLLKMRMLLRNSEVRNILQDHYRYIMVDEYQDTNRLQEDIIFMLSSKYKNLAVVGDDYQSIYKFRGSDINNILNFPNKIENCKKIILNINYRSTKEIITAANTIMDHHAHFGYKKQMKDDNCSGKKVMANLCADDSDEVDHILKMIHKKYRKGLPLSEIAILARTGKETGRLEAYLNKNGIPYVKKGGPKFFELEAIRDILAYLKLCINFSNELSWSRVLDTVPGIGETYSTALSERCKEHNFLIDNPFKNHKFYKRLEDLNALYTDILLGSYTTTEIFDIFVNHYISLRQYKIDHMITQDEGNRTAAQLDLENDKEYIENLRTFIMDYDSLQTFLDELILDPNKEKESTEDMLTISTVHSAKGLEWNTVFLMNCVEHYFPCVSEEDNKEEFDEELRCFYVAITRAKEHLILEAPESICINNKFAGGLTPICKEASKKFKMIEDITTIYTNKRFDLNCSYHEKEIVKQLGARWDNQNKTWYTFYENIIDNPQLIEFLSKKDKALIEDLKQDNIYDYDFN